MTRRYADCGHAYDGATDSGYCKRCEADLREQWDREQMDRYEPDADEGAKG